MKVLWLSHFVPYPPRGGNLQRSFNLVRSVSASHEVVLVALNLHSAPRDEVAEYRAELGKYCSEVQVWDLPLPWKGLRWWQQLLSSSLRAQPFSTGVLWSSKLQAQWQECLHCHAEAVVHIDSVDLAAYLDAALGAHSVVLNHHNCESAMLQRRAELGSNIAARAYLKSQANKMARLEADVCRRVHANIAVCENDRDLLLARSPGAHVHVVENGTDADFFRSSGAPERPGGLVFAGSLRWYPNVSGLKFFRQAIWPEICRLKPEARLHLAGRDPVGELVRWAQQDARVTLTPSPDDIRPCFDRGTVFICPILDGGGTRLKILDALSMGKAVVTTSIGCEGLAVVPGRDVVVADDPGEFAGACLRLMEDPNQRRSLSLAGRKLVEDRYCWPRIARDLLDAYVCAASGKCPEREGKRASTAPANVHAAPE